MERLDISNKENPIPPPFDSQCFCAPNVLKPEEVSRFVALIKDGTQIDTRNLPTPVEPLEDNATRIVERVSIYDEELAEFLFDKVKQLCPQVWVQENEDEHLGTFSRGEWELENVHPRIQLYRYQPGGVFTKHRDGPTYFSPDYKSFFTVLIYLNDSYTGGHTIVYTDDEKHSYKVEPSIGGGFAMLQRVLHEGSCVTEGMKLAMRCDVMYKRSANSITPQEILKDLPKKEQAQLWLKMARLLESSRNICYDEVVKYYRLAEKLDPDLISH